MISELLWLNYHNPEQHIYMYVNSMGTQQPDGQAVGFETEAYAILATLGYIRPEVRGLLRQSRNRFRSRVKDASVLSILRKLQWCLHMLMTQLSNDFADFLSTVKCDCTLVL